jgi:hypothetical protein
VNRFLKSMLAGLMIGTLVSMAPTPTVQAQRPPEPAIVISIADVSQQMADVNYLVEAAGFGQMKFMAQTMIKQYTKGINAKSPAGVMLYFREDNPIPDFLAFIPVSNMDDMLDTIAGVAEVDEDGDTIIITGDDGTELMMKEVDGYAFISNKEVMFEGMPAAPAELLGELPAKYNFSAQIFGQRIPEELREQAIEMIKDGYEKQLEQMEEFGDEFGEESPLDAEMQKKSFDMQMEQMEVWLNETESMTIGMAADKESQSMYTDIVFKALPGSELANRFASYPPKEPSMFKGFLMPGAAFTMNSRMDIGQADVEQYQQQMEQLEEMMLAGMENEGALTEAQEEVAKKAVGDFIEIMNETLTQGIVDGGAVVMLEDRDMNFAMGLRVADPKKVENMAKELLEFAQQEIGDDLKVEFNSGSFKDVTYHQVRIPVPDEDDAQKVFGDELTILLGIGKKAIYIGAGTNPEATLNKAIGAAAVEVLPEAPGADPLLLQYSLHLTPIMKFAAGIEAQPMLEKMAAEMEANGRDTIKVQSHAIKDGMSMRFEMQDGILAMIKVAVENFGAGGGGFPGGDNDF